MDRTQWLAVIQCRLVCVTSKDNKQASQHACLQCSILSSRSVLGCTNYVTVSLHIMPSSIRHHFIRLKVARPPWCFQAAYVQLAERITAWYACDKFAIDLMVGGVLQMHLAQVLFCFVLVLAVPEGDLPSQQGCLTRPCRKVGQASDLSPESLGEEVLHLQQLTEQPRN